LNNGGDVGHAGFDSLLPASAKSSGTDVRLVHLGDLHEVVDLGVVQEMVNRV
jgi:hypothetical protein